MDVLRFTTAGSVDNGKSTLIGRLLVDSQTLPADQYAAIERASGADGRFDLAFVTDGLRAEREQGITIDVAYRYFATARRKFIIADTPGHEQYTRNMVTGASTAHLAVVVIDARNGVSRQSRRHGFISSLLRIPHLLVAVNKMDLVGYSESAFDEIVATYSDFAASLEVPDIVFVPVAALPGDNVVVRSARMPWYDGPTLLHHLEHVSVSPSANVVDFRLPVQCAVRLPGGGRAFAGQIVSGAIRRGERVVALPSGVESRIRAMWVSGAEVERAATDDPIAVVLDDEVDVGRGEMIVRPLNRPVLARRLDADLCWMSEAPLRVGQSYLLQHATRRVRAEVVRVVYRLDVDTLRREEAGGLELNDLGRVEISTAEPVCSDSYRANPRTGSFILIDETTSATVAAGMMRSGASQEPADGNRSAETMSGGPLTRDAFESRNGHRACVLWLTGLSGAGKSTIADALERRLLALSCQTMRLDGDDLRAGLTRDLGFSPEDRAENIRRAGEVARLLFERGCITICTFVSPYRQDRARVRSLFPEGRFFEIHIDCDKDVCAARDPKGLYRKAREGSLPGLTGVSAPYEPPERPELRLATATRPVSACVEDLITLLQHAHVLRPRQ